MLDGVLYGLNVADALVVDFEGRQNVLADDLLGPGRLKFPRGLSGARDGIDDFLRTEVDDASVPLLNTLWQFHDLPKH